MSPASRPAKKCAATYPKLHGKPKYGALTTQHTSSISMASDSSGHTARNDFPNPQTSRNTADIHALYNKDTDQVTIWATLTGDAPRTIDALLNDPRTDDDTGQPATPPNGQTPAQAPISQLGQGTPVHRNFRGTRNFQDLSGSGRTM
jgi:hypothetical protein